MKPPANSALPNGPPANSATASALPEFNSASLDELFSRDPALIPDADMEVIVEELRRMRATWETGQKPKPRASKVKLSLDDMIL